MPMKKDEKGALLLEAAMILPVFMIVMMSLICLISLYIVHAQVQYAITQTANEVAAYSYFYSYLGLRDIVTEIEISNKENVQKVNGAVGNVVGIINSGTDAMNQMSSLLNGGDGNIEKANDEIVIICSDMDSITSNADSLSDFIDGIINNPKQVLGWLIGYASDSLLGTGKSALGAYLLYPALTYRYLGYDKDYGGSKEDFLKDMGIENMDFSNSKLMPNVDGGNSLNDRLVDVVVTYDYVLPFSILPKEASTFHIAQRAVALGWGDGDDTYKKPA